MYRSMVTIESLVLQCFILSCRNYVLSSIKGSITILFMDGTKTSVLLLNPHIYDNVSSVNEPLQAKTINTHIVIGSLC